MRLVHFIALTLCVSVAFAQSRGGFNTVIASLRDFQTADGGFALAPGLGSSLEATQYALFLSTLFGTRDRIDSAAAAKFVESLKSADGGFSDSPGKPTSLTAVRQALLSYGYLGMTGIDKSAVETFVKSHYDENSKLFFDKPGDAPSILATATAFQIFNLLGASNREFVVKAAASVTEYLRANTKDHAFVFPDEQLSDVSANYYGILTGYLTGYKFEDPEAWAAFFGQRQTKQGGVVATLGNTKTVSLEATTHAVSAVYYLWKATGVDVRNVIDLRSLVLFLRGIPHDITAATLAHTAISRTSLFPELFQKTVTYEILNGAIEGETIVTGTQIKPVLSVKTYYGIAHAGLTVEATLTYDDEAPTKLQLHWNQEGYVADEFYDTADKLGTLNIRFSVRINLVEEVIEFHLADKKNIGYSMKITSSAKMGEKEIPVGQAVGAGTEFNFGVTLSHGKTKITQGEFDVIFSVLDSSNAVVYTKRKDCRSNTDPIAFSFELTSVDLPSGALTFRFQVENSDGVHTENTVTYQLVARMVATYITYDANQPYKLGDTVTVTMQPGSLVDSTVTLYDANDADGNLIQERTFYLDTYDVEGETILRTVKGVPSEKNGRVLYTFEIPVSSTFDSIGTHQFTFRYVPVRGKEISLLNYDSKLEELLDESQPLTYTVKAELQVADMVNAPKEGSLHYGNNVSFSFTVVDAITGNKVWYGERDDAIRLNLRSAGSKLASATIVAKQNYDQNSNPTSFSIDWIVSPNAAKGPGYFDLTADIAGEQVTLVTADKKPWSVKVEVGGNIIAKHTVESISSPEGTHNTFLVTFELSCEGKKLSGAQLQAVLTEMGSQPVAGRVVLPVSRNDETGIYTVSWLAPDALAQSGSYTLQIFRAIDKDGEPLFTVSFNFAALHSNILPFRTETLVLTVVIASLAFFSMKKYTIENPKAKHS